MPSLPNSTDLEADPHADAHYYRGVLHSLIDMGADLARLVHSQAAAAPLSASNDPTIPFDRIARCIRRSIALARSLDHPAPRAVDVVQHRIAARKRIIRDVEDVIQRQRSNVDTESLQAELCDRLDEPDLDDDIDGRPTADIIADICRDLGLGASPGTHPWKRRTPADIAALQARAAQPYDTPPNRAPPAHRRARQPCGAAPPGSATNLNSG